MACRLSNIVPICEYNVEGIAEIKLLDFVDFRAFGFLGENLYDSNLVTSIHASGPFVSIPAGEGTKYSGDSRNGLYTHSLDSFIQGLAGSTLSTLSLAVKRRQIVFFKTAAGRWYTFGYEAGAGVNYTNQTAELVGSLVSVNAASVYPLFEVTAAAMIAGPQTGGDYRPADYDTINDYL